MLERILKFSIRQRWAVLMATPGSCRFDVGNVSLLCLIMIENQNQWIYSNNHNVWIFSLRCLPLRLKYRPVPIQQLKIYPFHLSVAIFQDSLFYKWASGFLMLLYWSA